MLKLISTLAPMAAMLSVSAFAQTTDIPLAEVQMELSTGRPKIDLMINGQGPYTFVFDTGAAAMVVRSDLVEALDLPVVGEGRIGSPGGEPLTVDLVGLETTGVGSAERSDIEAYVIDMGMPLEVAGYGVIGPEHFRQFGRVAYDFTNNTVIIGGEAYLPEGVAWIPMGDSAPILDATLEIGELSFPIHIDTGNPDVLSVPQSLEDSLPLTGPSEAIRQGRMVNQSFTIYGAPLDEMASVGQANIPLSRVAFTPRPFGNLGTGGLRGTVLEIDWENDRFAVWGEAEPVLFTPRRRGPQ